ncbi:MAG TPA: ROK family transcriptional regulator [Mycobacteriales bacterium]|nr:ROK family transcriptional regulator [Mycobacteriales bacterium]
MPPRALAGPSDPAGPRTQAEVFAAVLGAGPMSRGQVAQRLGVSASTVTKAVNPLVREGYLCEGGGTSSGPGRPVRLLSVNQDRHVVVGVKLAPTRVTGVVTDMAARVLARVDRPVRRTTPADLLGVAGEVVRAVLGAVPDSPARVLGVGVGIGGHVDAAGGACRYSALLGWRDVDVAVPLVAATGLPVVVNNDVNALAVAERWFGAGRDVDSFAVVTVGVGIGCGLLLGGELFVGTGGMAGELGHLPLVADGPRCTCGSRGCLEAVASGPAVLRGIQDRCGRRCGSLGAAVDLARAGQGAAGVAAREAFAVAGDALGRGLAALCNLLNLGRIILSGEGVVAYDLIGPALIGALRRHAFSTAARDCEILVDAVNDDAWARGAACLVIHDAVVRSVR